MAALPLEYMNTRATEAAIRLAFKIDVAQRLMPI